jgi:hypothetical protein
MNDSVVIPMQIPEAAAPGRVQALRPLMPAMHGPCLHWRPISRGKAGEMEAVGNEPAMAPCTDKPE